MKTDMMKKIITGVACAAMLAVGTATMAETGTAPGTGIRRVNLFPPMVCENAQDEGENVVDNVGAIFNWG